MSEDYLEDGEQVGTMVPKRGELIPAPSREVGALNDVFGALVGGEINNFDGDNMNRWKLTQLATGPQSAKMDDIIGQTIEVRYWFCHKVEIADLKTGELKPAVRVVLITPELKAYVAVSDVVARDMARIVQAFGTKPLDPPLVVVITQAKSRQGRKFLTLQPVI